MNYIMQESPKSIVINETSSLVRYVNIKDKRIWGRKRRLDAIRLLS